MVVLQLLLLLLHLLNLMLLQLLLQVLLLKLVLLELMLLLLLLMRRSVQVLVEIARRAVDVHHRRRTRAQSHLLACRRAHVT